MINSALWLVYHQGRGAEAVVCHKIKFSIYKEFATMILIMLILYSNTRKNKDTCITILWWINHKYTIYNT